MSRAVSNAPSTGLVLIVPCKFFVCFQASACGNNHHIFLQKIGAKVSLLHCREYFPEKISRYREHLLYVAVLLCHVLILVPQYCFVSICHADEDTPAAVTSKQVPPETDAQTITETGKNSLTDAEIFAKYQKTLHKIIDKCNELNMILEAKITRQLLWETDPYGFIASRFPRDPMPELLPEDATAHQKSWYRALLRLRQSCSDSIFQKALEAADQHRGFDAFQMVLTTLYVNPDHAQARKVLGYSLVDGCWRTAWELRQIQRGLVDHPKYGWIRKEDVPAYDAGKRLFRNQWISEEEDNSRPKTPKTGWKIETEHYVMETSCSLEEGTRICRRLEMFYVTWLQLFYRFTGQDKQWAFIVSGHGKIPARRHKVTFFKNRAEYVEQLKKRENNIESSYGGYFPQEETIFIYFPAPDEGSHLDTLLVHEATHQLFQECRPASSNQQRRKNRSLPGKKSNFWVLEAFSTYMETFRADGNVYRIGGTNSLRFQRARERATESDGLLSLRVFSGMSIEAFQRYPDLAMLYTQSAGLASFFLHYDHGRYRNAFILYLYLVYEELDSVNTLERLTKRSFEQMDEEFHRFMLAAPGLK